MTERVSLKDVELKLISELMKNSRRSDRQLAKAVGVSQPTVGRIIAKLEKEGVLREYTVIPDFRKLGYNIVSIMFGDTREGLRNPEKIGNARRKFIKDFDEKSFETILDLKGIGMKHDGVIISFHRNYSEFVDFKERLMETEFADLTKFESFLIDLNDEGHHRHLTFSYLAEHLLQPKKTSKHQ